LKRLNKLQVTIRKHKTNCIKGLVLFFTISLVSLSQYAPGVPFIAFAQPVNPNLINSPPFESPDFQELAASQKASSTNSTCTLSTAAKLHGTPQQTEGPYFVDGMPNRSDIRSDTLNNVKGGQT
jgi:hypothetical protein